MILREEYEKGSLQYQEISPEKNVFDFERIRLFSIVANSTAIEGATLTFNEVEQLIDMDILSISKANLCSIILW